MTRERFALGVVAGTILACAIIDPEATARALCKSKPKDPIPDLPPLKPISKGFRIGKWRLVRD